MIGIETDVGALTLSLLRRVSVPVLTRAIGASGRPLWIERRIVEREGRSLQIFHVVLCFPFLGLADTHWLAMLPAGEYLFKKLNAPLIIWNGADQNANVLAN